SQRKLQRKTPAVGSMQSKSTSTSETSSHRILPSNARAAIRESRIASSAAHAINVAGATKPHLNSAALCGIMREEKSAQFTVQQGRINPGSADSGTIHCQCAALA